MRTRTVPILVAALVILTLVAGGLLACSTATPAPTAPQATTKSTSTPAPAATAKKVILKSINDQGPTTFTQIHSHSYWASLVNQKLAQAGYGDQYEVVTYPAEQLAKANDMFQAVKDGAAECGPLMTYDYGMMPLLAVADLPFLYRDHLTQLVVRERLLAAGLGAYIESFGVHMTSVNIAMPTSMMTKKPVRKLEDMKGLKIRTSGGISSEVIKALAGVPVSMPVGEAYTAISAGTVDGVQLGEPSLVSYKIYEVGKYNLRYTLNGTSGALGIVTNLKTWNSLPKPVQVIMEMAGKETAVHHWTAYAYSEQANIDKVFKGAGMEVNYLAPEEAARWKAAAMPIWDDWVKKNGDLNNGLGRKLWQVAKDFLDNPRLDETGFEKK